MHIGIMAISMATPQGPVFHLIFWVLFSGAQIWLKQKSEKRGRKLWEGEEIFCEGEKMKLKEREWMGEKMMVKRKISPSFILKRFSSFFNLFSTSFLTFTISFLPDSLFSKCFFSNHFLEFVFPFSFPHRKIIAPSSCWNHSSDHKRREEMIGRERKKMRGKKRKKMRGRRREWEKLQPLHLMG